MNRLERSARFLAMALFLAAGCGDDSPQKPRGSSDGQAPDFSLVDVNPNSPTQAQPVSPRNYLGKVSAWYFGHST